ncbi:hypothetical protein OIU84_012190 [Salix udensis]|uniref:Uncharacterized protein n=1 Tax=Salix udensis TaxID=889485 RepID=A0AAD6JFG2_9ROSI|nr:hypothetical protein OIU84_012190 [Salix udensis]
MVSRYLILPGIYYADCAKHDPEVSEDAEKNFAELLKEELQLRETDALENQRRADIALLEAKKIASQYQKEADKCNSGMETCEGAREKAEGTLAEQKKLTSIWELRARQRGWKDVGCQIPYPISGKCPVCVKDLPWPHETFSSSWCYGIYIRSQVSMIRI